MPVAILHLTDGVFVGHCMGLAFFAKHDTVGQSNVVTCETHDEASALIAELSIEGLSSIEVDSGHWRHLRKAGIDVFDMPENERRYGSVAGIAE